MSMSSVVSRRANSAETRAARQVVRDKRLALMLDGDNRWESYLAVTSFVVSSERSITGDVDRMAAEIRAVDHPIKNVAVAPSLAAGGATVSGQVQVTDFRNSDSVIANDGTAVGKPRWVNFMMTVPISAKHAPIAIYGHGLTASKETQLIVTETNLARGIATIGIDVPDHGGRAGEGGPLLDITFPETMGRLSGMLLQGELDQLSLLMAITHHFGEIDLAPFKFSMTPGDGIADFDPERVYYEATSMGGVLGLVFLGLAPEVDGAFIQVAGAGILDTLLHSDILWPAFGRVVPRNADAGEANVIIGASQRLIDRGDPTYYLQRVQDYKMPLYLVYSVDDGVVSNGGTERMANLLGLPLVGQQFGPITPGTVSGHVDSMPADGRGVQQIPTAYLNGNFAKPFLSHLAFVDPIPMHAFRDWLDDRLATPR
jgi:pimeloyl-ACP methyl ester carboxylesterase